MCRKKGRRLGVCNLGGAWRHYAFQTHHSSRHPDGTKREACSTSIARTRGTRRYVEFAATLKGLEGFCFPEAGSEVVPDSCSS